MLEEQPSVYAKLFHTFFTMQASYMFIVVGTECRVNVELNVGLLLLYVFKWRQLFLRSDLESVWAKRTSPSLPSPTGVGGRLTGHKLDTKGCAKLKLELGRGCPHL